MLGIVTNEVRTHELERAKLSVTPALGGESFGLVLAEAFACATPAVASDIPGLRGRRDARGGACSCRRATRTRSRDAVIDVLSDEPRRVEMGRAARAHALANYAWDDIARRLEETYREVIRVSSRRRRWRLLVVPLLAVAVALVVWRGPDWQLVHDAFTAVRWAWVVAAIGLNLLSVSRARSRGTRRSSSRSTPPHPALPRSSSPRSRSACSRTRCCPGRVGELARVAVLRRRIPGRQGHDRDARRLGLRAPDVRPVPGDRRSSSGCCSRRRSPAGR